MRIHAIRTGSVRIKRSQVCGRSPTFSPAMRRYTEALMLAGQIDGVGEDDASALATLQALKQLAAERHTVYFSTHDPESAERLSSRRLADVANHQTTVPGWRK